MSTGAVIGLVAIAFAAITFVCARALDKRTAPPTHKEPR